MLMPSNVSFGQRTQHQNDITKSVTIIEKVSPTSLCHQYTWFDQNLVQTTNSDNLDDFYFRWLKISYYKDTDALLHFCANYYFSGDSTLKDDLVICRFNVFKKASLEKQFSFLISKIKDTTIIISFSQVVSRSTISASVMQTITRHEWFQVQDQFGFSIQDDLSKSHWKFNQSECRNELEVD